MKRNPLLPFAAGLAASAAFAADRPIAVPPALQSSWEFVTSGSEVRQRPQLGVGLRQRSSGAKPGAGANSVSAAVTAPTKKQATVTAPAPKPTSAQKSGTGLHTPPPDRN